VLSLPVIQNRVTEFKANFEKMVERPMPPGMQITCEDCSHNDTCHYAWDLYNTDGDCLMLK
jgi:hypothetical protein